MSVIILRRPKLGLSVRHLVAQSEHIDKVCRNDRRLPDNLSMVIRWGTTSNVPCNNIVNTAEVIHRVNDKAGFRRVLMDDWSNKEGIGLPLCPTTWFEEPHAPIIQQEAFPLVVRPRTHAQGKHVYLCHTQEEMAIATARCGPGWYASIYVPKVAEYRVTFVQGRVVWVAEKTPGNPNAIAWNVSQGGRFDNVRWDAWNLRVIRHARDVFMLTGLHFGAVDIMVDEAGKVYALEVNSAPSQTSPYRQQCMAKAFDYLIEHGKEDIPIIEERGGWKKFIHPALTPEAQVVM